MSIFVREYVERGRLVLFMALVAIAGTTPQLHGQVVLQTQHAATTAELEKPTDAGCANAECRVSQINISTGFNHAASVLYRDSDVDAYWKLVESPVDGVALPNSAYIIPSHPSWRTGSGSRWISAYNYTDYNEDNPPPARAYTFQRCFCLCKSTLIRIVMEVRADNDADIYFGSQLIGTMAATHNTVANFKEGLRIDRTIRVGPGRHCIRAELRNYSRVAMGLNISGSVTVVAEGGAQPEPVLLKEKCCDPSGSILGRIINDKNCNGRDDNTPSNGSIDPGLAGWTVTLNPGKRKAVTDANGYYVFDNVKPGRYTVTQSLIAPWKTKLPANGHHSVTLSANEAIQRDFLNCEVVSAPCEKVGSGTIDTRTCVYTYRLNRSGGPVKQITYAVTGATIVEIRSGGCPIEIAYPGIAGSTSGTLAFRLCDDPLTLRVKAAPTTPGGEITIRWGVYSTDSDSCIYTTTYHCPAAELTQCDSLTVGEFPYPGSNLSRRAFTINNIQTPLNPIRQVRISLWPKPSGGWLGGGLSVDSGIVAAWDTSQGAGNDAYSQINLECLPRLDSGMTNVAGAGRGNISFNLGLDYAVQWNGRVTVTMIHCNGDSCTDTYDWDAQSPLLSEGEEAGVKYRSRVPVYSNRSRSKVALLEVPGVVPASDVMLFRYWLPATLDVKLDLFDALGTHVASIANGPTKSGDHSASFITSGLANGTYIVQLTTSTGTIRHPVVIQRGKGKQGF